MTMKELRININLDNDAFQQEGSAEIARILHKLADYYEDMYEVAAVRRLFDVNGNSVGKAEIIKTNL
jgi:hypothetical protein